MMPEALIPKPAEPQKRGPKPTGRTPGAERSASSRGGACQGAGERIPLSLSRNSLFKEAGNRVTHRIPGLWLKRSGRRSAASVHRINPRLGADEGRDNASKPDSRERVPYPSR
jgi:hypothetical protein